MPTMTSAADLRAAARRGEWRGTTAGHCPAYQQANLAILPMEAAVEFAAFCAAARVELMITHEPAQMFLTDLPREGDQRP